MKYARIPGLFAVVAAALMLSAGSALATNVTSPVNTVYTGELKAESEGHVVLHSENAPTNFTVECQSAVVGNLNEDTGSGATTARGPVSSLVFNNCTNGVTVIVNKTGNLEVHTDTTNKVDGNGTVTSSGAEVTVHVPGLNIKCIYTTSSTHIGTLKGSKNTGSTATLEIQSTTIPRTAGSAFCGSGGIWTGSYKITTPDYLDVD